MRVIGWGKPLSYDEPRAIVPLHAIVELSTSFVTACAGRWSRESSYVYYPTDHTAPAKYPNQPWCQACLCAVELARALVAGTQLVLSAEVR